jgi:16S rRNA G966 N2-methylase RsmD
LAIDCLRKNLHAQGIGPEARILAQPAEATTVACPGDRGFDLIFLDPPYRLSEDPSHGQVVPRVIKRLGREIPVATQALLVWRHEAQLELPPDLSNAWRTVERRGWGNMAITLFERMPGLTN